MFCWLSRTNAGFLFVYYEKLKLLATRREKWLADESIATHRHTHTHIYMIDAGFGDNFRSTGKLV